jgi:sensor histidine kinase regulating citrate/malate metabolism
MWRLKQAYNRIPFQIKVIMLTGSLIIGIFIVFTLYIQTMIAQIIEEEVRAKAMAVAEIIAQSLDIIAAFDEKSPEVIIGIIAV